MKKVEENRTNASGESLKEADDIYESYEATRAMALKLGRAVKLCRKTGKTGN